MSYYPQKQESCAVYYAKGMIHACYGQGSGKTTRAIGLAIRAAGAGLRVTYIQFMKCGDSGEVDALRWIPRIQYYCPGCHPFIKPSGPEAVHLEHAQKALKRALESVQDGSDVLVCDEILNTLIFGVLPLESVTELMELCRGKVELVMTGIDAPDQILQTVDYATEFVQRRHPYYKGVPARQGIEL